MPLLLAWRLLLASCPVTHARFAASSVQTPVAGSPAADVTTLSLRHPLSAARQPSVPRSTALPPGPTSAGWYQLKHGSRAARGNKDDKRNLGELIRVHCQVGTAAEVLPGGYCQPGGSAAAEAAGSAPAQRRKHSEAARLGAPRGQPFACWLENALLAGAWRCADGSCLRRAMLSCRTVTRCPPAAAHLLLLNSTGHQLPVGQGGGAGAGPRRALPRVRPHAAALW